MLGIFDDFTLIVVAIFIIFLTSTGFITWSILKPLKNLSYSLAL